MTNENGNGHGNQRGERLQIMLSPEELELLDDFRFRTRMPSRAATVRELLKRGLAAEGFQVAAFGAKSSEYGVSGAGPAERAQPAKPSKEQKRTPLR